MQPTIDRRDFLRRTAAGAAALGAAPWLLSGCGGDDPAPGEGLARREDLAALADRLVVAKNPDPRAATLAALDALGGARAFVESGSRVVVKPNMAWARAPEFAANTNPAVVAALVESFVAAGAGEVLVLDRTCNPARLAYRLSGIADAAEAAGARVVDVPDRESRYRAVAFPAGSALPEDRRFPDLSWPILKDVLDADLLVNVPVAKQHGVATITLGLKNLMGVMGGKRGSVHTYIHEAVALLGTSVRPHLTVLDATRILVDNGPTGGDLADVVATNTVVAGVDPAAVDAWGVEKLPWRRPPSRDFLERAAELGVGVPDLTRKTILAA